MTIGAGVAFCLLTGFAATLPGVLAHGFVTKIRFSSYNGDYVGPPLLFGQSPSALPLVSIIRQTETGFPLKGANNVNLTCNQYAAPAHDGANVMPGNTVEVFWAASGDGKAAWPHNLGPILTYLAECPKSGCPNWDAKDAKWFKIDQKGRIQDDPKFGVGTWASQTIHDQQPYVFKLPANLAAGQYIMRSEVIALHFATKMYSATEKETGAEFYPSCAQIYVGGSETGKPEPEELVSFPGAYKDDDPGLYVPQLYYKPPPYVFPGPPIASFISGDHSSGGVESPGGASSSSTLPSSTAPPISSEATKSLATELSTPSNVNKTPTQKLRTCKRGFGAAKRKRARWSATLRRSIYHT